MKNINFKMLGWIFIIALFLIPASDSSAGPDKDKDKVSIAGTVIAMDWDEEDNIIRVAISVTVMLEDSSEYTEDYIVIENEKGKELYDLVGEVVKAVGVIGTDDEDYKTITISAYEVVKKEE